MRACPVRERAVTSRDETGLDRDSDDTTNLEDDVCETATDTGKFEGERLDDVGVHADKDDHSAGGTDDLTGEHVLPVVVALATVAEGEQHTSGEAEDRGDGLDETGLGDEPW